VTIKYVVTSWVILQDH